MSDDVLVRCPSCGEEVSRTAPRKEKDEETGKYVFRGNKVYCRNSDCERAHEPLAQRPITLCEHPEDARDMVPGHEHVEYCKLCGVLDPESQDGWQSKDAPWV